jgi:hypothetical protein
MPVPAVVAALPAGRRRGLPATRRRARGPAARGPGKGPRALRLAGAALLAALLLAGANVAVQVARKPSELFGLVLAPAPRTPADTWARYGRGFRAHATDLVRPELLAALAQAESQGDPLARPPWRWRWTWNPLEVYAPASSAVGLYQITDAAFAEGRRLCVHGHRLARTGPWHDPRSCWFAFLYSRAVPGHAIEMTAARLHDQLLRVLGPARAHRAGDRQRERLAGVIHLCGPGRAAVFARRGFEARPGERCGAHDLGGYLRRVERLARTFERLAT